MAKFNWNRVRNENNIGRYGSEYVKSEREIYFRGRGTDPQSVHQNKTSSTNQTGSSPPSTTNSEKYSVCPHCEVKFIKDKLQNHIEKAHQSVTKPHYESKNPINPLHQEVKKSSLIEIKVGNSGDGRIRLPASIFSGKSGKAIVNGITYTGNPGDAGRCKVLASTFGAKPGQIIRLIWQCNNEWTTTVNGVTRLTEQPPKLKLTNTTVNVPDETLKKIPRITYRAEVGLSQQQLKKPAKVNVNTTLSLAFHSQSPFSDKDLRDWFFETFTPDFPTVDKISTTGSSPFVEDDLDLFFKKKGITVRAIEDATEVLVIGREGWDEEDLLKLLDKRAGKHLKVYSQEMFLAYWMSGCDPLKDRDTALKFAEGHPALEFLSNTGFDWASTFVSIGNGDLNFDKELPTIGVLRHVGYKVGVSGLVGIERHQILSYVFNSELPTVVSHEYMKEWGKPKSKERLQKMANSLAAFCRNEKRKSRPSNIAITEWEDDLDWLKKTYYTGRFTFQYPSI